MKNEALVLLEFEEGGLPLHLDHFVMKGLDTLQPLVQVNDRMYEGVAEQPIGTFMVMDGKEHVGNISRTMKLAPIRLDLRK
jgi:hypothetical protein